VKKSPNRRPKKFILEEAQTRGVPRKASCAKTASEGLATQRKTKQKGSDLARGPRARRHGRAHKQNVA